MSVAYVRQRSSRLTVEGLWSHGWDPFALPFGSRKCPAFAPDPNPYPIPHPQEIDPCEYIGHPYVRWDMVVLRGCTAGGMQPRVEAHGAEEAVVSTGEGGASGVCCLGG